MRQLEDLGRDKDSLNELANELRGKSTDLHVLDIDSKAADVNDKFTQLQAAMANRCVLILLLIRIFLWLTHTCTHACMHAHKHALAHTHTTVLWLSGFCPGQPE